MRSSPAGSALPLQADRRLRGYAEICVASLILGTSAMLVQVSTMPAGALVVTLGRRQPEQLLIEPIA